MREPEEHYIDAMGQFMESWGLPRMAGRMYAWLLICEPPEQTALEIGEALGASRGAVSGAARMLTGMGLIRRGRRRGARSEIFSVQPGSMTRLIESASSAYQAFVDITEEGLRLIADRPVESRLRLQ